MLPSDILFAPTESPKRTLCPTEQRYAKHEESFILLAQQRGPPNRLSVPSLLYLSFSTVVSDSRSSLKDSRVREEDVALGAAHPVWAHGVNRSFAFPVFRHEEERCYYLHACMHNGFQKGKNKPAYNAVARRDSCNVGGCCGKTRKTTFHMVGAYVGVRNFVQVGNCTIWSCRHVSSLPPSCLPAGLLPPCNDESGQRARHSRLLLILRMISLSAPFRLFSFSWKSGTFPQ